MIAAATSCGHFNLRLRGYFLQLILLHAWYLLDKRLTSKRWWRNFARIHLLSLPQSSRALNSILARRAAEKLSTSLRLMATMTLLAVPLDSRATLVQGRLTLILATQKAMHALTLCKHSSTRWAR